MINQFSMMSEDMLRHLNEGVQKKRDQKEINIEESSSYFISNNMSNLSEDLQIMFMNSKLLIQIMKLYLNNQLRQVNFRLIIQLIILRVSCLNQMNRRIVIF